MIGFVHGFAVGFLIVALVADKHPVKRYREAGFEVAAAHVLGHVAYGAGLGVTARLMPVELGFRFWE